jgi:PilZ domain
MSSTVKIQVGPKLPLIDCKLVDYSAGGACLEIFGQVKLPDRFEMFYGNTRKRCRVVWSKGRRVGVSF